MDSGLLIKCHFHYKTSPNDPVWRQRQRPGPLPSKLPVISQPDDNILMTSPLILHMTWLGALLQWLPWPLTVIPDCGGMLIMVRTPAVESRLWVRVLVNDASVSQLQRRVHIKTWLPTLPMNPDSFLFLSLSSHHSQPFLPPPPFFLELQLQMFGKINHSYPYLATHAEHLLRSVMSSTRAAPWDHGT